MYPYPIGGLKSTRGGNKMTSIVGARSRPLALAAPMLTSRLQGEHVLERLAHLTRPRGRAAAADNAAERVVPPGRAGRPGVGHRQGQRRGLNLVAVYMCAFVVATGT
ncbi:hypothetical protein HPB50_025079 [Hyalomma asiaticum]|uniref:Uncharacterized protein n=1 Tax=Hyalomma asiaticum TaxID=266040 RepID=A0ACB7SQS2_HYAAI|nr:hypothetical protein HPB50_025079 [Hyalomma asiaticum]